ncbi:MAG: Gfo/Idh/MocA family oxidoreductase [Lentisphaerae bacterium]|nr:Gfo/Idh/MocA family oxidoreductase [Lentisphaerota bacterium]
MSTDQKQSDGMMYAPKGKPAPVVTPGAFVIAAAALDHGHIYGQCNGLVEAGATLKWVYDPDPRKVEGFRKSFPQAQVARSVEEILDDKAVHLVAAASVPSERGPLGVRVMQAGKDYFSDKSPFTTLAQLEDARHTAAATGRKYMVYYGERLHVECAMHAGDLIQQGAIGRVVQVIGLGPHRLNAPSRPAWFFDKQKYGGILCDIGSHQCEQFLAYTGAKDARVLSARVENFQHPEYPGLEDFGEATLVADNGASFYFRVDWFTPKGLATWGDGRTIILGTDGYIELRKYIDVARAQTGDHLYLVNQQGTEHMELAGKVGYRFFGELILDCVHRTERAMTQAHAFKAAELSMLAQEWADAHRRG